KKSSKVLLLLLSVVGAQHAVPGKHTWLFVRHLPRANGATRRHSEYPVLGFARSAGISVRCTPPSLMAILSSAMWSAGAYPRCLPPGLRRAPRLTWIHQSSVGAFAF